MSGKFLSSSSSSFLVEMAQSAKIMLHTAFFTFQEILCYVNKFCGFENIWNGFPIFYIRAYHRKKCFIRHFKRFWCFLSRPPPFLSIWQPSFASLNLTPCFCECPFVQECFYCFLHRHLFGFLKIGHHIWAFAVCKINLDLAQVRRQENLLGNEAHESRILTKKDFYRSCGS